jgi:hypothetical protein
MPRPSVSQIRTLHRENRRRPEKLAPIPATEWPDGIADSPFQTGSVATDVFRSRDFLLVVWDQSGTTRLSVMRTDFDLRTRHQRADITWDDLQRLKGEAGYGKMTAVEIYPPDDRVVNVANMRHLFLVDAPRFMW